MILFLYFSLHFDIFEEFYYDTDSLGVYKYKNSPIKLVESLQESFTNLSLESEEINKNLSNPENLALLKNIMNKM